MIEKHLPIHPIAFLVIDATFFFFFRQVPMVVWCVSAKIHSRINPHYFVKLVVDGREKKNHFVHNRQHTTTNLASCCFHFCRVHTQITIIGEMIE